MCKAPMKEHVGQKLPDMEIAGHEKMQAKEGIQVNAATSEHPRCQKRQHVNGKKILGHGRYVVHLLNFYLNITFNIFSSALHYLLNLTAKLLKISRF